LLKKEEARVWSTAGVGEPGGGMAIEDTRSEGTGGWHDGSWLKKTMQMQA